MNYKKIVLLVTILLFTTKSFADFSDVSSYHPYYDAIIYAQENSIVNGYKDGTFQPESKITREEFTKIIVNSNFSKEQIYWEDCFPDVVWWDFEKYICTAKREGIISWYKDGTFWPKNNITFLEATKIIILGLDKKTEAESTWINWLEKYGYYIWSQKATPYSINLPNSQITRWEMVEIIWRLKENIVDRDYKDEKFVFDTVSCTTSTTLNKEEYWIMEQFTVSEDGTKKIYFSMKWKYVSCKCPWWETFEWDYYFFEEENWKVVNIEKYNTIRFIWFLRWNIPYIVYDDNGQEYLKVWDKTYSWDMIYQDYFQKWRNIIISKDWKHKVLFFDNTFSEEYDYIFWVKEWENWDKVILAFKGDVTLWWWWEENTYNWDFLLIVNSNETRLDNVKNLNWQIYECGNKYWYLYSSLDTSPYLEKLNFDWVNYWEEWYEILNFYWFKNNTCEPIYVNIKDIDSLISKLYLWTNLIYQSESNIWNPKINWEDIYFEVFNWDINWYYTWYQLYKNGEVVEDKGRLQNYWFLKNWELIYSTYPKYEWILIKLITWKTTINWFDFSDYLFISNKKEHYAFNLRSLIDYQQKIFLDWEILSAKWNFMSWKFFKENFLSAFSLDEKNYIYINDSEILEFIGNPNVVFDEDYAIERNWSLFFSVNQESESKIMECK